MDAKELVERELGLESPKLFVDKRSYYFFFATSKGQNYMVLLKNEVEPELLPLLRKFDDAVPELPKFLKETSSAMLFALPSGKLARLTEEKISVDIRQRMIDLQTKINGWLAGSGYHWRWELNYFFITSSGLMYVDLETLEYGENSPILTPPVFGSLGTRERILLKIRREKRKADWKKKQDAKKT